MTVWPLRMAGSSGPLWKHTAAAIDATESALETGVYYLHRPHRVQPGHVVFHPIVDACFVRREIAPSGCTRRPAGERTLPGTRTASVAVARPTLACCVSSQVGVAPLLRGWRCQNWLANSSPQHLCGQQQAIVSADLAVSSNVRIEERWGPLGRGLCASRRRRTSFALHRGQRSLGGLGDNPQHHHTHFNFSRAAAKVSRWTSFDGHGSAVNLPHYVGRGVPQWIA